MEGQKVVTSREMARVERLSIEEGACEESYMLEAGRGVAGCVEAFIQENNLEKKVVLLIGKGNNGGDGYVVGRVLLEKGYSVKAYHLYPLEQCSLLCQTEGKVFIERGGEVERPKKEGDLIFFQKGVIVDALLGTGFQGPLEGFLLEVISRVNQAKVPVLAIDIPSGVNGNNGSVGTDAIRAEETIYLGLPKLGCFLGRGYDHIGKLRGVLFGLDLNYLHQMEGEAHLMSEKKVVAFLPPLVRTQHKYQAGYVLAVAGSPGMPGAAMLTSLAALRSGAGVVRLFHPKGMEQELATAPYELIRSPYCFDDPSPIWEEQKRAGACLIGPGVGKSKEMGRFLKKMVAKLKVPLVIDADALFHLRGDLKGLEVPCVITPHHQEMLSLLEKDHFPEGELLSICQEFCVENQVTLVLKGAPTFLFHPETPPLILAKGNPGMATAGTGDVLTGMIAAFLAKKLPPRQGAALGVYLHGLAGDIVAAQRTPYDMIASDLIEALPKAFKRADKLL